MKTYGRKKTEESADIIVYPDEICRLCLAREEQLLSIFNDDEPVPLPLRIMACVALEVVEDDGLPAMICRPCHYQLEKYYVFRKKCENSDLKLRRQLKGLSGTPGDLPPAQTDQHIGSTVTFLIPEEGEVEGDQSELEEGDVSASVSGGAAGGSTDNTQLITLPKYSRQDPYLICPLKREHSDDEDRELKESAIENVELLRSSLLGRGGLEEEAERGEGEEGEAEGGLRVRLLQGPAPTHVEVTTQDGSVLFMELTTEDMPEGMAVPEEPERDENGELKVHQCDLCPKAFARLAQLKRHSSVHLQRRGVTCGTCEKWFPSDSAYRRHERIHTGEKPFQCIVCERCFAQREILYRHLLTHSDKKPFTCSKCEKGFTQREALRVHMNSHMSPRPALRLHRCNICDKLFCHASGLSRHLLTHSGRLFKCKECDKQFNDKSSLRRHLRVTNH